MGRQEFRDYLSTKGLKSTRGRDEIIEEIMGIKGHFDPEGLFVRLKNKGSKVSRASVYRTLPLLIESGFIEEVERTDKHSHYERVMPDAHHDHMICIKCGRVIEFFSPTLEMMQDELCRNERFKKVRHNLEIFGYCSKCGG